MDNSTFVKLDRNIIEWQWFSDPLMVQLVIYFIVRANVEPKEFRGLTINRGEVVTSLESIAEKTGQTAKQVRARIDRLKECGFLSVKRAQKFYIYKVENYDRYQERALKGHEYGQSKGTQTGTQRAVKGHGYKNNNYSHNYLEETKEEKNVENVCATPPTFEELQVFSYKEAQHVNLQRFWDFYQEKGWPDDWQAKMREWEAKDKADGKPAININPEEDEDLMWIRSHTKGLNGNEY